MNKELSALTILFLGNIATTHSGAVVMELPEGKQYKDAIQVPRIGAVSLVLARESAMDESIPAGSIAYYPIFGEIRYASPYYWRFNTSTFLDSLRQAEENPSISAHLLHIDSQGGEAYGCHEAFEAIKALKKPCFAVLRSCAGSAGYYLAAAADKIYAESPFSMVGCIGTMCTMVNDEKYLDRLGIKVEELKSNYSPLKNKVFDDAMDGKTKDFIARFLDPLALQFIDDVASVRAVPEDDDARKGETYYATEAQRHALIDGVKSFEDAVLELDKLAEKDQAKRTQEGPSFDLNDLNF